MKVIILAGGIGTRLWPLSSKEKPKQFIKLHNQENTLFQDTIQRSLTLTESKDILIVTNRAFVPLIDQNLRSMGFDPSHWNILLEPEAKNTLPAIYAGVSEILKKNDDLVVVFPSDHLIAKPEVLRVLLLQAGTLAKQHLVTVGIQPNRPHTGYGYICPGDSLEAGYRVKAFKEKPARETAEVYMQNGYLWNAGIFLFQASLFADEVRRFEPAIAQAFDDSFSLEEAFSKIKHGQSIDYGIMERSERVAVVPAEIGWNDVGSFDSFFDLYQKNESGNIAPSNAILVDAKNSLIQSSTNKRIAAIGIENLIIIDSEDAVLVCKRDQSQGLRQVAAVLQEQAETNVEKKEWIHRSQDSSVQRIRLSPGESITIQASHTQIETCTLLEGSLQVGGTKQSLSPGESFKLKAGKSYSFINAGQTSAVILRIQAKRQ